MYELQNYTKYMIVFRIVKRACHSGRFDNQFKSFRLSGAHDLARTRARSVNFQTRAVQLARDVRCDRKDSWNFIYQRNHSEPGEKRAKKLSNTFPKRTYSKRAYGWPVTIVGPFVFGLRDVRPAFFIIFKKTKTIFRFILFFNRRLPCNTRFVYRPFSTGYCSPAYRRRPSYFRDDI